MRSLRSEHWTAILLILASVIPIGSWILMASWGVGGGLPVVAHTTISDGNPIRWWFLWWALLPLLLIAAVSTTVWLYKNFLRNEAPNSIGAGQGLKVFALEIVLFLAILFVFALLILLAESTLS